jgi:ectoine hydroxylase-related dioxygenase (phytanoyl-CoA dioxygenase family)
MDGNAQKNAPISRIFAAIRRRLGQTGTEATSQPLITKCLWFDEEEAIARISSLQEHWLKDAVLSLRNNGFALLPANVASDLCDQIMSEFKSYAASRADSSNYRDKWGLHERLANLHLVSPSARQLALNPRIIQLMSLLFENAPRVVGSLLFEKGSTQSIHRDTPAFFTNPLNNYFGVWTALQDIDEDAGPLTYYPGGHRLVPDADLYSERLGSDQYFKVIIDACKDAALPLTRFFPKKGDTLVWHPQLPHGGGSRLNPAAPRHSMVFHYMNASAAIYPPNDFFAGNKLLPARQVLKTLAIGQISAIDHGQPQFFHNREEGNFDEF